MLHLILVCYSWYQTTMNSIDLSEFNMFSHVWLETCMYETSNPLILAHIFIKTKWLQEVLPPSLTVQYFECHFNVFSRTRTSQNGYLKCWVSLDLDKRNCITKLLLALCGASKKIRKTALKRWYQGKIWQLCYWESCCHEMHHKEQCWCEFL